MKWHLLNCTCDSVLFTCLPQVLESLKNPWISFLFFKGMEKYKNFWIWAKDHENHWSLVTVNWVPQFQILRVLMHNLKRAIKMILSGKSLADLTLYQPHYLGGTSTLCTSSYPLLWMTYSTVVLFQHSSVKTAIPPPKANLPSRHMTLNKCWICWHHVPAG